MARRFRKLDRLEGTQGQASDPREHVWLSASAGTGKTHVLSARVLRLLLRGEKPEAVLCLTFTKAGAAEMAERINTRLADWVMLDEPILRKELFALREPNDPEAVAHARTLFARVLDAPGGGLRIQTIHAFCQTLLAGFPAEAGLAPGFRPLEGREESALARRALGDMIDAAEAGGDHGLVRAIETLSRRLGEAGAEAYLLHCAREPDAMAALGPGIAARVRRALDVRADDVEAAIEAACADFDCSAIDAIVAANRAWGTATGLKDCDRCAAFLAASPRERAAMLTDLAGVALTQKGEPRAYSAKLLAHEPAYAAHAARLADACTELLDLRRRAALAALLAAGLRAGQTYARAYADAKRAAGVLDFDDLIRHAERLLTTDGMGDWVRYKLDQATDHILVDEAQDTNTRQWAIVWALAEEFFAGDGAKGDKLRTIFSVGDFKQAIFGFQGTDPAAFRAAGMLVEERANSAARSAEEAGGWRPRLRRLALDRSFRSTPPVLALVDRLIDDLGASTLGLDEQTNPHIAFKDRLPGQVTLWRPVAIAADEADDAEEGWIDDATRVFATRLARQVKAWLNDPFWIAGRERPLRPEDIMILVRRRGELASLLVARLHEEGVPVAGVDRLRLTAPLAVRDLLAAIRFVLQPGDDLSLASLLVSPLFGHDQDALYRAAFDRGRASLWSRVREAPEFAATAAALETLLARADFTTPHAFIEEMLSGPLDARRKLLGRLGADARDPIEELVNAALAFEGTETPSLQRFLDWFDSGEVDITRDAAAAGDAVRVMTAHGAKGLQAPVVILADATGDPDKAPARGVRWEVEGAAVPVFRPRKEELAGSLADAIAAADAREREEHWRLLYVATTRAEERLVIGGALGPRTKGEAPAASWYRALDGALEGLGAAWEEDAIWGEARDYRGMIPPVAPRRARTRPPPPPPPEPAWLRAPAPKVARPPRPLAPSSIGEEIVADPPPSPAMRAAARRGSLLHALFERLPACPPHARAAAGLRWLEEGAGVADEGERRALVADACAIVADPAFADIFGPDALAEAPLAAVVDGIVVAGTVDRLLVRPGVVRVIDFKTGRRAPESVAAIPAHHLRQMGAYAAALARVFPGRAIEAGLLYTAAPRLLWLPGDLLERHRPPPPPDLPTA